MFRPPKTIIVIGIVAAVILAALYMLPAYAWEEGAPTASVNVIIEKDDGTTYEGTLEIEEGNILSSMTTYPMTTYTADVPPLNPTDDYRIYFLIDVTTTGSSSGETFTTMVSVTGGNPNPVYFDDIMQPVAFTTFGGSATISASKSNIPNGQPTQFDVKSTDPFRKSAAGGQYEMILGSMIDGSVFQIEVVSTGSTGSYGMTTATLGIVVGAGGTLSVQIDSITTTVSEY